MPANRFVTVNDIVNQVAVEVGLAPVVDVYAGTPEFTQLTYLLNTCGQRMWEMYPWQICTREYQRTTIQGETGKYPLPEDFGYMIEQTGWERSNNVPLIGPLSAQDWTYLLGRDLVGSTIYASFRFDQNEFWIFPNDPVPPDLDINFEYISRYWATSNDGVTYKDRVDQPSDIVLYPETLITRYLKMAFRQAKGFDTGADMEDFNKTFYGWAGRDNSAPILNGGSGWRGYPYLDMWRNLPDTGYGRIM